MICVFFSFNKEISSILERLEQRRHTKINGLSVYEGFFVNCRIRLVRTGMGCCEISGDILSGCESVISTGFCGGLSPDLEAGDIVFSREIVYITGKTIKAIMTGGLEDNIFRRSAVLQVPEPFRYVSSLENKLQEAKPDSIFVHVGRTVTSERILYDPGEKRSIHAYFDAVSVDMEDFFRAAFAQRRQLHVVCARAVLDRAEDTVPSLRSIKSVSHIPGLFKNYKKARHSIEMLVEDLVLSLTGER